MTVRIFNTRLLSVVFGIVLAAAFFTAFSTTASAHGYVSKPESRGLLCKTGANKNCGGVQYEPQSLEAPGNFPKGGPADGKIPGVNLFPKLNEQTASRWAKVPMKSGSNTFEWTLTAAHATAKWDYYITKQNWRPDQPIKRSDLDLFCSVADNGKKPAASVKHTCKVPARSGYQVILAVWNIADTPNAFYNVIDAKFDGTAGTPAEPKPEVKPETKPNTWSSTNVYTSGKEVLYKGILYRAKWWTQGEKPDSSAAWERINQNENVTPAPSASDWNSGRVYVSGNQVTYKGSQYRAKWWTQGEKPGNAIVWELMRNHTGGSTTVSLSEWNKGKVYSGGDKVTYKGGHYSAKWWTQGNTPSTSEEWAKIN